MSSQEQLTQKGTKISSPKILIKKIMAFILTLIVASIMALTAVGAQEYVHFKTFARHAASVHSIVFVDNHTFISGGWDNTLRSWDFNTGAQRWSKDVRNWVHAVAVPMHDPSFAAYAGREDHRIRMRDTDAGDFRDALAGHTNDVHDLAFKPQSYILASGSLDGTIRIWDMKNNRHVRTLPGHRNGVYSIAWSPDGSMIASAGADNHVRLWDPNTGENFQEFWRGNREPWPVSSVGFSPDGITLVIGDGDGNTYIWDMENNKHVQTLSDHHTDEVHSVAFHPNGQLLATASRDATICLWDLNTGNHVATLPGHTDAVESVVFHPNGQTLVSGSKDGTIRLWRASTASAPKIVLVSHEIDDRDLIGGWSNGNGNGELEPGERITFTVKLKNEGEVTAQNVIGTLSTDNNFVRISDNKVNYGNMRPTGLSYSPLLDSFKFEVPGVLTTQVVKLTLTITADNDGSWSIPIELDVINPAEIDIVLPTDLISEAAIGENVTYFILNAQYPTLTGTLGARITYGDCTITLHIPSETQAFIFPIKTKREKARDAAIDVIVNLPLNLIPLPLVGTLKDVLELFIKVNNIKSPDLEINFRNRDLDAERPETVLEYVVLLKNEGNPLEEIEITIEQEYGIGDVSRVNTRVAPQSKFWDFSKGWAAPTSEPIALSDYPSFQLLPLEVQNFLLPHFSAEEWRMPKETSLLPNYPNPFNPETWLPYQLSKSANVTLYIHTVNGRVVRTLSLGHQPAGIYQTRSRAAYWDGKNGLGEPVASGLYFYTLTTGDFTATRRMLILK